MASPVLKEVEGSCMGVGPYCMAMANQILQVGAAGENSFSLSHKLPLGGLGSRYSDSG